MANAGADFDRIQKLGASYCSKAPSFLNETDFPQKTLENLKKELQVYASLCSDTGDFVGKKGINYPDNIPVNVRALYDSWQTIGMIAMAGKIPRAPIARALAKDAEDTRALVSPVGHASNANEYAVELQRQGVNSDEEIQKRFGKMLVLGLFLNQQIRK